MNANNKKKRPNRRWALLEALYHCSLAWMMIRLLPYSIWKRWLGEPVSLELVSQELKVPKQTDGQELADIAWAHRRLASASRGFFTCLMLGFSARAMLRRRGGNSVLILGVAREKESASDSLGAHAWVVYESFDVAGGFKRHQYAAVAAYSA